MPKNGSRQVVKAPKMPSAGERMPSSRPRGFLAVCRFPTLLALSLLAALDLAMFGGVLLAGDGRVLGAETTDMWMHVVAWRAFGFGELAHGRFPLWNPHIYSGTPYFGAMQTGLMYPPNVLFLVLPLAAAINWCIVLHTWLLGAFMFGWARARGLAAAPAFFAGALLMFCGAYFPKVYAGHLPGVCVMAWAPLIFWVIDAWILRRRGAWLLLGMGAVALQVFAGYPQYVFYTAIAAGWYALLRLSQSGDRFRGALGLLSIYPGGAALAAAQLLTGVQASAETVRGVPLPWSFASMFAFPPENFLTLLAPNFFGPLSNYWGRCYLWEMSLFIGVTGCVLAVYAAALGRRQRTWPLLAALALTLLLALGKHTPLFELLYRCAPGFNKFRGVSKFIFPASLFLVMLAATGLDELFQARRAPRRFTFAVGALALALGVAGVWVKTASPQAWSAVILTVCRTGESYVRPEALTNLPLLLGTQRTAAVSLLTGALVAALAAGLLELLGFWRGTVWALLAVGVLEVFIFARGAIVSFNPETITPPDVRRFYKEQLDGCRVLNTYNSNVSILLAASDLWGYDPFVVRRYAEFMTWSQGDNPDEATIHVTFKTLDPLYALLRLRYGLFFRDQNLSVVDAPAKPLPHVSLVSRYRVLPGRDAIFAAMRAEDFDPWREVLLEREPDPRPAPDAPAGSARIVEETTDALTIEADAPAPAILLITDVWTPAWRATALAGGAQTHYDVLPADYIVRAVPLAAGHHRLRVEYAPRAFAIGAWISVLALIVYAAAWIWLLAARRGKGNNVLKTGNA
jgi:hypothetical protein